MREVRNFGKVTFASHEEIFSSEVQCHIVFWKATDILGEHVAVIFRAEEYARQDASMKAGDNSGLHGIVSQMIERFITTNAGTSGPMCISYIK
jgi:hypothetical protein